MSEVKSLFRFCPSCGKRFHIKLVSKKLVGDRKENQEIKQAMVSPMPMGYAGGTMPMMPMVVEENIPITIDIEDFQYTYKCKHCGHEWTEAHVEERKAS